MHLDNANYICISHWAWPSAYCIAMATTLPHVPSIQLYGALLYLAVDVSLSAVCGRCYDRQVTSDKIISAVVCISARLRVGLRSANDRGVDCGAPMRSGGFDIHGLRDECAAATWTSGQERQQLQVRPGWPPRQMDSLFLSLAWTKNT
jgi:hypothetical protein